MDPLKRILALLVTFAFVVLLQPFRGLAHRDLQPDRGRTQQDTTASKTIPTPSSTERDGQHDFDWNIGTWKTHQKRLLHPLTGSHTWVEYDGTDVIRKIWEGKANIGEIEADGPAGHLELLSLRLYNPASHQWSFVVANSTTGTADAPMIGEFKNRRAEFINQQPYNDRIILVRISVADITPNSCRFEQAFSDDGGKTWEANFIVNETRTKDDDSEPQRTTGSQPNGTERNGQHDFDFEIGAWKTHVSRLLHPLTGSNTRVKLEGTVVIRKVWNGRANLMELEMDTPNGHLEELNLRLYNPQSHQWNFNFANSSDGSIEQPMFGEFKNGRGEFIHQEQFNGRVIQVRHVFSDIRSDSHHFEQSFSDDGGKTWEPNFVATLIREATMPTAKN